MAPAFLAVLTTPGPDLPVEEFQDWYENEHVPLRMNHLRSFVSGARYHAIDPRPNEDPASKAQWLAMYEIDDSSTFSKREYTRLREDRSERETGVIKRMGILVRICAEEIGVWGDHGEAKSTGLKLPHPTQWVITHGLGVSVGDAEGDKHARAWAEGVTGHFKERVPGWVRSRVVKVIEGGVVGVWATGKEKVDRYWVVHEMADEISTRGEVVKERLEREELGLDVGALRLWNLFKAYPGLAQGNIQL